MDIIGHVKHGTIVLDEALALSGGTRVRVEPLVEISTPAVAPEVAQFAGLLPADIDIDDTRLTTILEKHP